MKLTAVFNAFDTPNAGGIQVSGRVAWQAISRASTEFDARALLISLQPHVSQERAARTFIGNGRLGAIRAARDASGEADVALFWHLDLLKLLPFLGLGAHCRKVVFLHGTEAWKRRSAWTRRRLNGFQLALANSSYTVQQAIAANPEFADVPTRILPLGLGSAASGRAAPDAVPAAVMIARLDASERYKGHDEVLQAWPLILQRVPDAQLWIVGDGDLRADLERAVNEAGLDGSVRFFGRVTEAEKQTLIERARCMLLPSTGEGFGLVYLEAMRLGRPCLVGVDGGYEVVNPPEAGLSVTHRAPQEIADAAVRLLRLDDAWEHMSVAARARYERTFTARHFGERMLDALRAVSG